MYYNHVIILLYYINYYYKQTVCTVFCEILIFNSPKYTAGAFTLMFVFLKVKMLGACLNKEKLQPAF